MLFKSCSQYLKDHFLSAGMGSGAVGEREGWILSGWEESFVFSQCRVGTLRNPSMDGQSGGINASVSHPLGSTIQRCTAVSQMERWSRSFPDGHSGAQSNTHFLVCLTFHQQGTSAS